MTLSYYEDIKLHEKFISKVPYVITQKEIIKFAREYDPQPMHVDPEFASKTGFGKLLAPGTHLLALCSKLAYDMPTRYAHVAGLGGDESRFLVPVHPGDALTYETEVISKRHSKSDPDAGVVRWACLLKNQRGEAVLTYKLVSLVAKKSKF